MNIVLCVSDLDTAGSLEEQICQWAEQEHVSDRIRVSSCQTWDDFLEAWEDGAEVSLLFLDADLTAKPSGVEKANDFFFSGGHLPIILLKNEQEYIQSNVTAPLRILSIPLCKRDLFHCLTSCADENENSGMGTVVIRNNGEFLRIPVGTIDCLEHLQRHTLIYTGNTKEPYMIRDSLSNVYAKLPQRLFVHCHKSYVVNLNHISTYGNGLITLASGRQIPMGRAFSKEVIMHIDNQVQSADRY